MEPSSETRTWLRECVQEEHPGDEHRLAALDGLLNRIGLHHEARLSRAVERAKASTAKPEPPQPPRRSEMTRADKLAYIGQHGADAFMQLPE